MESKVHVTLVFDNGLSYFLEMPAADVDWLFTELKCRTTVVYYPDEMFDEPFLDGEFGWEDAEYAEDYETIETICYPDFFIDGSKVAFAYVTPIEDDAADTEVSDG